jgi:hypothetical protein
MLPPSVLLQLLHSAVVNQTLSNEVHDDLIASYHANQHPEKHGVLLLQEVRQSLKTGAWFANSLTEQSLTNVLEMSFNDLSDQGKHMFLDCVSVLQGQDSSKALAAWSAWWGEARTLFTELKRRSLVLVDEEGRLTAHDVIKALGQAKLQKQGGTYYASRVWVGADGQLVKHAQVGRFCAVYEGRCSNCTTPAKAVPQA